MWYEFLGTHELWFFHPVSLATIVGVVALLAMAKINRNSYYTTLVLVVVALLISTMRELIRFDIISVIGSEHIVEKIEHIENAFNPLLL